MVSKITRHLERVFECAGIAAFLLFSIVADSCASKSEISGDIEGASIYRKMHRAVRKSKTLFLQSEYAWEVDGREIGRSIYSLWLKKPNFARLESQSSDGKRHGTILLDGSVMWILWPEGKSSAVGTNTNSGQPAGQASFARKSVRAGTHSIGSEINSLGTGMTMPILDPSIFHGLQDPMDAFLERVIYLRSEEIDGETCYVIEAEFPERNRTRTFWVSRKDFLPRMLVEKVRMEREVIKRERWTKVTVNSAILEEIFSLEPLVDWLELRSLPSTEALLSPGTVAPDFDLELLDGSRFVLSNHRGKIVWLCFWHLSCLPCREELDYLSKIQKRYRKRGLIVLGIDFTDDKTSVGEYLSSNEIAITAVSDTSAYARDLFHSIYQRGAAFRAVPLNYIVDRDGRIADAWYGFERGSNQGASTLERLAAKKDSN